MSDDMKCTKCDSVMKEVSRTRKNVLLDVDREALAEGQLADYEVAEMDGDGEWGALEITYECTKCGYLMSVQYI